MTDSDDSQTPHDDGPAPVTAEGSGSAPVWRRWQLWVILAAVAVVIAVSVPLLTGRGGGFANATGALPGASASGVASTHPGPTRTLAPAVTPEEAAATVKVPAKLRVTLRRWNDGRAGKALAAVSNDMGTALQAGGVKMFGPMKAACASLTFAIKSAKAGPPIPNAALQMKYASALTQLAKAAASCTAAISERAAGDETVDTHENLTLLRRAETGFSAGIKDLYRVTAELTAAGR